MRALCGALTIRSGSSSTSTFAPSSTVAAHSVDGRGVTQARRPVGLLLQAARVGDDDARLGGERGEIEVAERLGRRMWATGTCPLSAARCADARGRRRFVQPVERLHDPAEPRLARRSPRGGRWRRRSRRARGRTVRGSRSLARDRRKADRRIGHHVADHLDLPADALARGSRAERSRGRAGAGSRSTSIAVCPRASTSRRCACPARHARAERRPRSRRRAGKRRVGVAVDEQRVGLLGRDRVEDPAAATGEHSGAGGHRRRGGRPAAQAELLEEDLRQLWGRSAARCGASTSSISRSLSAIERGAALMNCGRFPTTESTFTAGLHYAARRGPLAQLVEQGTLNPKVEGSNPSRPTPESPAQREAGRSSFGASLSSTWRKSNDGLWRTPPGRAVLSYQVSRHRPGRTHPGNNPSRYAVRSSGPRRAWPRPVSTSPRARSRRASPQVVHRVDDLEAARTAADHDNHARPVTGADEDVLRPRRAVDEVPGLSRRSCPSITRRTRRRRRGSPPGRSRRGTCRSAGRAMRIWMRKPRSVHSCPPSKSVSCPRSSLRIHDTSRAFRARNQPSPWGGARRQSFSAVPRERFVMSPRTGRA